MRHIATGSSAGLAACCALALLLTAGCGSDPERRAEPADTTTAATSDSPSPSASDSGPSGTTSSGPAAPEAASGPRVRREHYAVNLPDGFQEMPSGALGDEAVVGCTSACTGYLAISDPTPAETDDISFDLAVDSMVRASTLDSIERLPDEEHLGRRTYHLAGTDGKSAMHEFGLLAPGYELSVKLTMPAPPEEVEQIARAVLASLTID